MLKVFLPDVENALEADALRHYDGRGAARLLTDEPGALLLERLRPGTSLWSVQGRRPGNRHPRRPLPASCGGRPARITASGWLRAEGER